jgi:hypothetical protein
VSPGDGVPRRAIALAALVAAVLALAACGSSAPGSFTSAPVTGAVPTVAAGSDIRAQLVAALSARNLLLVDAKVPFRPAEPPDLATVPRTVYQVQLRNNPGNGFIVAYQLANPQLAASAGTALAAYLSSGPGRVQSPLGTVHVIRQVGATLLYYRWLPGAAIDPLTPGIQAALETLGTGIPVSN